jgi:uncharacterized membrane protein
MVAGGLVNTGLYNGTTQQMAGARAIENAKANSRRTAILAAVGFVVIVAAVVTLILVMNHVT